MRRITALTLASAVAISGGIVLAPDAFAKNGGDVKTRGTCSDTTSMWVARAKAKDTNARVDFWVKTKQTGQSWSFTVAQNGGAPSAASVKTTRVHDSQGQDNSGHVAEVKWRTFATNAAGPDSFLLTAVNTTTNASCSTTVTLP